MISSTLLIMLTLTVAAQGYKVEALGQSMAPDMAFRWSGPNLGQSPLNTIGSDIPSEITFTSVATSYLPIIFRYSAPCVDSPVLLYPPDGGVLDTLIPLFSWDNGYNPYGTQIRVDLALDSGFTQLVTRLYTLATPGVKDFRFSHNLDPATIYYWRAWFECDDTQGPYSERWSFTTGANGTILPAPALLSPVNGSVVLTYTATLQWSPVPGVVEYLVHWREAGENGSFYDWVTDTQRIIWVNNNTTYEWWVSARNVYAIGTTSDTWQFTTQSGSLSSSALNMDHSLVMEDGITGIRFEIPNTMQ